MGNKSTYKPVLFLNDNLLELQKCLELMPVEKNTTDIDVTTIFLFIAPDSGRAIIFHSKSHRIYLIMATGAIFPLTMGR